MENGCELYVSGVGQRALDVTGGGVIRTKGNNAIFVDDGVAFRSDGRGIDNTTHLPRDFQLYAKNRYTDAANVFLGQTSASYGNWTDCYGVVYNDNGNVRLERDGDWIATNYYGALVACGTLTLITQAWGADLAFSYDETLATVPFPTSNNPTAAGGSLRRSNPPNRRVPLTERASIFLTEHLLKIKEFLGTHTEGHRLIGRSCGARRGRAAEEDRSR